MTLEKKDFTLKQEDIKTLPTEKKRPQTVKELKKKYRHLPLHFLFGIEKEIDYQCPILDVYLGKLAVTKISLEKIRTCRTLESAKIHAATGLHSALELPTDLDLHTRENFEKLRRMAEGWKKLAIEAMNETKDPEKFIKI